MADQQQAPDPPVVRPVRRVPLMGVAAIVVAVVIVAALLHSAGWTSSGPTAVATVEAAPSGGSGPATDGAPGRVPGGPGGPASTSTAPSPDGGRPASAASAASSDGPPSPSGSSSSLASASAEPPVREVPPDADVRRVGLAARMATSLAAGPSFRASGTLVDPDVGSYQVDLAAAGDGDGMMTMRLAGGSGELRLVDGAAYLTAQAGFWKALGTTGAVAALPASDAWVRLGQAEAAAVSDLFRARALLDTGASGTAQVAARMVLRGASSVDGTPAWVLEDPDPAEGVRVYLPTSGAALPLRVVATGGSDLRLSAWGRPVSVQAP